MRRMTAILLKMTEFTKNIGLMILKRFINIQLKSLREFRRLSKLRVKNLQAKKNNIPENIVVVNQIFKEDTIVMMEVRK